MRTPEVGNRLSAQGYEIVTLPSQQFATLIKNEVERWKIVIAKGRVQPDQ